MASLFDNADCLSHMISHDKWHCKDLFMMMITCKNLHTCVLNHVTHICSYNTCVRVKMSQLEKFRKLIKAELDIFYDRTIYTDNDRKYPHKLRIAAVYVVDDDIDSMMENIDIHNIMNVGLYAVTGRFEISGKSMLVSIYIDDDAIMKIILRHMGPDIFAKPKKLILMSNPNVICNLSTTPMNNVECVCASSSTIFSDTMLFPKLTKIRIQDMEDLSRWGIMQNITSLWLEYPGNVFDADKLTLQFPNLKRLKVNCDFHLITVGIDSILALDGIEITLVFDTRNHDYHSDAICMVSASLMLLKQVRHQTNIKIITHDIKICGTRTVEFCNEIVKVLKSLYARPGTVNCDTIITSFPFKYVKDAYDAVCAIDDGGIDIRYLVFVKLILNCMRRLTPTIVKYGYIHPASRMPECSQSSRGISGWTEAYVRGSALGFL